MLGQEHAPCALIFAISSLDLLMLSRQNLLFQNLRPLALLYTSDFQYLGGIEPVVRPPPHDRYVVNRHFVHGYTGIYSLGSVKKCQSQNVTIKIKRIQKKKKRNIF